MAQILVIDDEVEVTTFLKYFLQKLNYNVSIAHDARTIDRILLQQLFDIAIVDLKLPDTDGLTILKKIKTISPATEVIIMTGYSTMKTAVDAIQLGAYDYIEKPFEDIEKLRSIIEQGLEKQTTTDSEMESLAEEMGFIVGTQTEMRKLFEVTKKIAIKNISALIYGETGTGKEILARFIHNASPRQSHPFIGVNCGAISHSLLESELFGHEKGAFTGANQMRKGVFEIASKGTLFLDEVGEASLQTQVKLLRVLETHEYMRVGGEETLKTNTRVISATNVDLETAVNEKKFRSDLLYRLEGVKMYIPPLRERLNDLPVYIDHFIRRILKSENPQKQFTAKAIEVLQNYNWPGNIRELYNTVHHTLALLDPNVAEIDIKYLPEKILQSVTNQKVYFHHQEIENLVEQREEPEEMLHSFADCESLEELMETLANWLVDTINVEEGVDLQKLLSTIRETETKVAQGIIKKALYQTMGNRKEASALLRMNPRSIRYLLMEKGRVVNAHE